MGKKKSVVLMTLLTIVIVVLCAITAFPTFAIPGTVKKWQPAVMQIDAGMDISGGYYAYYYPEGVIPETEYDAMSAEQKADYVSAGEGSSLYFNVKDYDIVDLENNVTEEFQASFDAAVEAVTNRFQAKDYAEFRVAVVDGYSMKVTVPASEVTTQMTAFQNAAHAIGMFSYLGKLTLTMDGEMVSVLKDADVTASDLISSVKVKDKYDNTMLKIGFTSKGREALDEFTASEAKNLEFKVGDVTVLTITADHISGSTVEYYMATNTERRYVETFAILLKSAINEPVEDITFKSISESEILHFEPIFGKNTLLMLYVAILAVMVALIAFAIVTMNKFGVVNMYVTLSYFIITALCYVFISGGVLPLTFGGVFTFLIGLVLVNVLHARTYKAIKAEFAKGRTVESSVKDGYKKTIMGVIDVYSVLLLGALAMLIGVAGMHMLAIQALICIITGAFCNLAWGRAINYVFFSTCKSISSKYKYFRFVREEDDDDE